MDFVGLDFADKKEGRQLPVGLVSLADPFPESDISEVEIIVGDSSNFGQPSTLKPEPTQEDGSEFYKPKVSTWGLFPRPGNISKTFGGGKVIRPRDVLKTEEAKAAKEERTRQLPAAYKKRVGLNVDPKIKSECEKALKEGDSLMDSGMLKEALPYYEKVMDKMAFKIASVDGALIVQPINHKFDHTLVASVLKKYPSKFVGCCLANPKEDGIVVKQLEELVLKMKNGKEFLLTNTIGFIQKLPTTLVAAFRATMRRYWNHHLWCMWWTSDMLEYGGSIRLASSLGV